MPVQATSRLGPTTTIHTQIDSFIRYTRTKQHVSSSTLLPEFLRRKETHRFYSIPRTSPSSFMRSTGFVRYGKKCNPTPSTVRTFKLLYATSRIWLLETRVDGSRGQTEQNRTEQNRTEQNRTEHVSYRTI